VTLNAHAPTGDKNIVVTAFTMRLRRCLCERCNPFLCYKVDAMTTYWGSGGIASRFLRPRHQIEVNVQFQAPATLSRGKNFWYPLDRRLGGLQSRSGRGVEV
jgi:hypothetical protein